MTKEEIMGREVCFSSDNWKNTYKVVEPSKPGFEIALIASNFYDEGCIYNYSISSLIKWIEEGEMKFKNEIIQEYEIF